MTLLAGSQVNNHLGFFSLYSNLYELLDSGDAITFMVLKDDIVMALMDFVPIKATIL